MHQRRTTRTNGAGGRRSVTPPARCSPTCTHPPRSSRWGRHQRPGFAPGRRPVAPGLEIVAGGEGRADHFCSRDGFRVRVVTAGQWGGQPAGRPPTPMPDPQPTADPVPVPPPPDPVPAEPSRAAARDMAALVLCCLAIAAAAWLAVRAG
jgi:hypothetical protein